ncbi:MULTISPECIES: helix-turn-helix domain-containing protein [Erwinia]|uniref:Regulatory protein PchR n=1 Tax=Erwinia rhapontici TaxID=55212 RepID=A0ABN6DII3_ERWRD|nr:MULTISPECIES: AraC family transcriptional regulator [Erwinia]MCS3605620.1 AraC family transcriptional activator of pyochelin receptor [Erwinia rhapontici]NNS09433.1 helix-turn-helix transcriptional regulator [Erwinia sp. JH02]BCQ34471.1 regulatory protein PchR [Erwinia rhapontici]BCQ39311.1 regulatory protein PchR [Erwinia rhapontici]BCQ44481.1 regulatory protein PchR [Erwinia rhapontici]
MKPASATLSPHLNLQPVNDVVFDGSIALSSGSLNPRVATWETERLQQGLKLIVVDGGELLCRMPQAAERRIVGPCVCAVWNQGESESMQRFEAGRRMDYSTITLSPATLASRIGGDVHEQLQQTFQLEKFNGPRLLVMEASAPIQALRAQVASCPMTGIARALYLSGKALEIVAHALEGFSQRPARSEAGQLRLSTADIERLHQAKDLLADRLLQPPSLAELALSVGINTRKLTVGFRRLFGESVFEYLQNLRLQTAWQMLTEGEMSVSTTAYRVGYTPAHFSVAFRKKFGVSPKSLRGA